MAINKKLITFDKLVTFQGANGINLTTATQTEAELTTAKSNVPYRSIVFIKDTGLIWTHGKYFNCSVLSLELTTLFVTLDTALTISGAKTFSSAINGDLLGNATTADRLKQTTLIGSAALPVYFNGGLPVSCTYLLNKTVPSNAVFTDTATAVDNILDGSNSGTAVTYAPYTSLLSKLSFDTSTTNPTRTDRLNLNGYLYGTKLFSNGKEVLTEHLSLSNYVTLDGELIITGDKYFSSSVEVDSLTSGNLIVQGSSSLGTVNSGTWNASTIDVSHGGTGSTSFTANSVIISGTTTTSPLTTRAITNNTSKTAVTASTDLITANTLYYHSGNSNITTVGTISSGTWHGSKVADAYISSADNWNSVYSWYTTNVGDVDDKINKWKEVEAFLDGISDTSTLTGILGLYVSKEADASLLPVHTHINTKWPGQFVSTTVADAKYLLSGNGLLKDLGSGSYLLLIIHSTDLDGAIYTGYFSYTTGSGTDEEIILHRSGNVSSHDGQQMLFAKIKYITDGTYLLLSAIKEESDCTELTIKMKKLL